MRRSTLLAFAIAGLAIAGCQEEKRVSMPETPSAPLGRGVASFEPHADAPAKPTRLEDDPAPSMERPSSKPVPESKVPPGFVNRSIQGRGPSRMTGQFRPQPSLPPADEAVSRTYQTPNQTISVEAVCSLTESEISCWDMDGRKSFSAEQRVRQAIERNMNEPYGQGVPIRFGFKNRLLVIKTVQKQGVNAVPQGFINILSAGSNPGGFSGIQLDQERMEPNAQEYVRYETRMLAEKRDVKETSLRLNQTSSEAEKGKIPLKVGETASFLGYKVKVESIASGAQAAGMYIPPEQKAWTITLSVSGQLEKNLQLNFMPTDDKGHTLMMVDSAGNPVSMEQRRREIAEASHSGRNPQFRNYSMSAVRGATMSGNRTQLVLHVNPAKVASLQIQAIRNKVIEVTGIPLDPK